MEYYVSIELTFIIIKVSFVPNNTLCLQVQVVY